MSKLQKKFYKPIIQPELIQNYLKIEIENKSYNINQNYIIVFSNKDENCLEREQLSLGIFKTQMWLTKKQIENNISLLNVAHMIALIN